MIRHVSIQYKIIEKFSKNFYRNFDIIYQIKLIICWDEKKWGIKKIDEMNLTCENFSKIKILSTINLRSHLYYVYNVKLCKIFERIGVPDIQK